MKIVQIEDFFHPDAGYQINVLSKYLSLKGHEVIIVTSEIEKAPKHLLEFFGSKNIEQKDSEYTKATGVKIIRVPVKRFISSRALFDKEIFQVVDALQPDVLYVHGNDTLIGMQYLLKSKRISFPLIMDSHMLKMASKNKLSYFFRLIYRNVFSKIINSRNIPVIRTQNDDYIIHDLGVRKDLAPWISFGTDTLLFQANSEKRSVLRNKYDISDETLVVIYAGKLDESKGGVLLASSIKKKFDTEREVVFLIVGNSNGLQKELLDELLSNSENRIIRFNTQKYKTLIDFYSAADVAVFPKQCSLSFFDVQSTGLPVILEDNDLNLSRVEKGNGSCFKAGDIHSLRYEIEKYIKLSSSEYKEISNNSRRYIEEGYDYRNIVNSYLEVIEKSIIQHRAER